MFASLALLLAAAQPQADAAALVSACAGKDGWDDPAPPARIHGSTYYVGTCGISAILITSPRGHVLIDGGTERAAPLIAANVERLGFRMRDVRLILNSHKHHDHAAYVAAFRRSLARIGALRCDLLLTPHHSASRLFERLASGRLSEAAACRDYAAGGVARLDARLAQEVAR